VSTELAWAAGFFDGEGTISQTSAKGTRRRYLILRIGHVDPRPLRRLVDAIGVGHVRGPYQHKKGNGRWSDYYVWQLGGTRAEAAFAAIRPWLLLPKLEQYGRVKERIS
jgi:hypothetical protein